MEQFVTEQAIGPVMKFLTNYITKELGYVACSKKHVKNMKKIMTVLESMFNDVNNHVERNVMNNKEIPSRIPGWLHDVKMIKEKADSISTDVNGCLNMKKMHRAGRNAFKTINEMERLINEKIEWSDANIPIGRVDSKPGDQITQNDFKSRDEAFKKALKYLRQDDKADQVIALCGMGGVGKTTMMEQLEKVARSNNEMFNWIVKVAIGRNPNMLSVQNDIAAYIKDGNLPDASKSVRADYLYETFKRLSQSKKKVLIILDDVWEEIKLNDIGLRDPLPDGIKLLLTSRSSRVCSQIASDVGSEPNVVTVGVLEESEAQNFFFRIAGVSRKDDHDKYLIGCDIVKKCGRLPLAIRIIASTLKSQEEYVWSDTLNHLKNNNFGDQVQEIINISYQYIKEDEDKDIFMLCSLFPEDYDIPIEDLTRYAWGLNLLKNVSTLREARDRTKTCVCNLINVNLLISSNHLGCVKMHDLVLAFLLQGNHPWIICRDISKWRRDGTSDSCKRISLTCTSMPEFSRDFKYPNLSLLQLMHGDKSLMFPDIFYENMENLNVIAHYKMHYPLLPRSLKCLKTLCLHECKIMMDYSFVGNLVNLQVLSFAHCGIKKLPSMIGNLRKLKLLDLTGCIDLHIDDGVLKSLHNLEELYMKVYDMKAIRFTDANFEELEILSKQLSALEVEFVEKTQLENISFKKLHKFKIAMGCMFKKEKNLKESLKYTMKSNFKNYSFKNTLKLVIDHISKVQDCKMNELFMKTEKLYLEIEDMITLEDLSTRLLDQDSFHNLRKLEVFGCGKLKYLFPIHVACGLRKLEFLKISKCLVLEALVHDYGSEINSGDETINFKELKVLYLDYLPKLIRLFPLDSVVELTQLVVLEVYDVPNFTSVYPSKNNISVSVLQQPFFNSKVKISTLEKLKIYRMEKLKQIWGCNSEEKVNDISMLRDIELRGCDSLVNMFPANPMGLLNHLESLSVASCGSIEVIFNIDLECIGEVEKLSSGSLRSINVFGSNKLREVWRIKGGENHSNSSLHIRGFQNVESIRIACCKMFRNVFTPTNTNFDMRAVVDISITDCGESARKNELELVAGHEDTEVRFIRTKQKYDNISTIAFPTNLIHTFHYLHNLRLDNYNGVEVVFEIESPTTTNNQQLLLPNLQSLYFAEMNTMSQIWKCSDWNILQKQHPQSSFHNLTTIYLFRCDRINYLFSPLMSKLLSNLKTIDIESCNGMEEVISRRDDEMMTSANTHTATQLQFLRLHSMKNLKRIDCVAHDPFKFSQVGVVSGSLYSREIDIYACYQLSSVIPFYAPRQMQKLHKLMVQSCESLKEVFETQQIINSDNDDGCGSSTNINEGNGCTKPVIPRLENIIVPELSNLKILLIRDCNLLQHIFTFSTLKSLVQLEELNIENCNAMKVIVKKENGGQGNVAVFPRLKFLKLFKLANLKGFFLGMNEFQWPLLEKVMIDDCPQLMMFTSSQSTAPKLKYIHTAIGKHSLESCGLNFHVMTNLHEASLTSSESTGLCSTTLERLPWSFNNMIELKLDGEIYFWQLSVIPSKELLQLQKLERIQLCHYIRFEEVFEVAKTEGGNNGFDESQTVVEIPSLREVEFNDLRHLKYIWKNNHHGMRTVLLFPNLTTVSIHDCSRLEHVFTSSMVSSLLQLQELHISKCPKMKVIVKEEEEFECEAKVKEIVLPCLKSLKLEELESLQGFCLGRDVYSWAWPSLHTLEITECPKIMVFTNGHVATPTLNIIQTTFGRYDIREDINSFIKTKQHEGLQF